MKCGTDIHGARQETLATLVITKLITWWFYTSCEMNQKFSVNSTVGQKPFGKLTFETPKGQILMRFQWNISVTVGWIAMKYRADIHLRMKRNHFDDFSFSAIIRSKTEIRAILGLCSLSWSLCKVPISKWLCTKHRSNCKKGRKEQKESSTVAGTTTSEGRVSATTAPVCCLQCFISAPTTHPTDGETYKSSFSHWQQVWILTSSPLT